MKILKLLMVVAAVSFTSLPIVTSEVGKTKKFNFLYFMDLVSADPNKNVTSYVTLPALFEYEFMQYLTQNYYKSGNETWDFVFNPVAITNDTTNLAESFYQTILESKFDFILGPRNTENLETIYPLNWLVEKMVISHGNTFSYLDDTNGFLGVLRVTPSDTIRIDVLKHIVNFYNWNYFLILYSSSVLSQLKQFASYLDETYKCAFKKSNVQLLTNDELCSDINYMSSLEHINVVILFTTLRDSKRIVHCLKENSIQNRFHLVFFHSHNSNPELFLGNEAILNGAIGIEYEHYGRKQIEDAFVEYFEQLHPNMTHGSDPLKWYWQERNTCNLYQGNPNGYLANCSGNETFKLPKGWDYKSLLTEEIRAMPLMFDCLVNILGNFLDQFCSNNMDDYCERLYKYYMKENFGAFLEFYYGENVACPLHPEIEELVYLITNNVFNRTTNKQKIQNTFRWSIRNLTGYAIIKAPKFLEQGNISFVQLRPQWWGNTVKYGEAFGNCSRPCDLGYATTRIVQTGDFWCCWKCEKCQQNHIAVESNSSQFSTCSPCGKKYKPDFATQTCIPFNYESIRQHHPLLTDALRYSSLTLFIAIVAVLIVVFRRRHTRLFVASGSEHWLIILVSMLITLVATVSYTFDPSNMVCTFRSVIAPMSTLLLRCFILVKAVRIPNAFRNNSGPRKGRRLIKDWKRFSFFMTSCVVFIEAILMGSIFYNMEDSFQESVVHHDESFLSVHCFQLGQWIFYVLHIFLCIIIFVQLIPHRNKPHNHSETLELIVSSTGSLNLLILNLVGYLIPNKKAYKNELYISWTLFVDTLWFLIVLFGQKIFIIIVGEARVGSNSSRLRSFSTSSNRDKASLERQVRIPLKFPLTPQEDNIIKKCNCPITVTTEH